MTLDRQPGVWYPDDVEKAANTDKTMGIEDINIVEELAWWFIPTIVMILLGITSFAAIYFDIFDLIRLGI
jgi:hypothetical protein